jgi:hypothetical protein
MLAELFSGWIGKNLNNDASKSASHVFYRIVDSPKSGKYVLQCINTSAVFYAEINEIVFDSDILHRLHPLQACYIGLEYGDLLSKSTSIPLKQLGCDADENENSSHGTIHLCYQDRKGNLHFVNKKTNENFKMDPCDIALSEKLLIEFDAAQAFYIGLLASLKMNNLMKKKESYKKPIYAKLRLIK